MDSTARETPTNPNLRAVRSRPAALSERTRVPLVWVLVVAGFVGSGAWKVASKLAEIENRLTLIEIRLHNPEAKK